MPYSNSGSGVAGFLGGLTGGFERGSDFKYRRDAYRIDAEERTRRRVGEDLARTNAERDEAWSAYDRYLDTGAVYDPDYTPGQTQYGPTAEPVGPQDGVGQLRAGVGDNIAVAPQSQFQGQQSAYGESPVPGIRQIGPSRSDTASRVNQENIDKIAAFIGMDPDVYAAIQGTEGASPVLADFLRPDAVGRQATEGVTATGGRTISGASGPAADAFAAEHYPDGRIGGRQGANVGDLINQGERIIQDILGSEPDELQGLVAGRYPEGHPQAGQRPVPLSDEQRINEALRGVFGQDMDQRRFRALQERHYAEVMGQGGRDNITADEANRLVDEEGWTTAQVEARYTVMPHTDIPR